MKGEDRMKCSECKHPQHEQFKGYHGSWYCFHAECCGRTICKTPVEDYDDRQAHGRSLSQAQHPKWCPLDKISEL